MFGIRFKMIIAGVFLSFFCNYALAQSLGIKGLVSGWSTFNFDYLDKPQLGLRILPEFYLETPFFSKYTLDFEFSLNAYGAWQRNSSDFDTTQSDLKLYRVWTRFSSSQFEIRLGLQKINFGSATLLRPLMWFDSIDPRDPLQITDGVYGLLMRYYFLNNANLWVWGLYGNQNTKGWELFASPDDSLEIGGRFQVPLGNGELALTYHHRQLDLNKGPYELLNEDEWFIGGDSTIPENRYALDGKWDIGVGIWFEAALIHQKSDKLPFYWQSAYNFGLDYTFGIGNGLNVLGEHYIYEASTKIFGAGDGNQFSAILLGYPLGILDTLSGIFYYDWDNRNFYRFINWQRTYDRWSFNVIGFWNPDEFMIYQSSSNISNLFAGKGFQILAVLNF